MQLFWHYLLNFKLNSSIVERIRFALFQHSMRWDSKKDAEASKIVTSPYNCTAEAIFGGRKSENIKF